MSENQILKAIKKLKQEFPKGWFEKAVARFGFDKVVVLLGEVNA